MTGRGGQVGKGPARAGGVLGAAQRWLRVGSRGASAGAPAGQARGRSRFGGLRSVPRAEGRLSGSGGQRETADASGAARGRHPGGRPGGGSPSPARRRRRSCSSPWRGRRSPEAAPGAQLRPGAPRHASRRAPGEGAAWPHTARRRRQRLGWRRVLRRRRGSGRAPATSPGGGGGGCAAPAPLLLLQLLPSGKGRAAAAAAPPPVPRLPPPAPSPSPAPSPGPPPPQRRARLPSDSPPPVQRRADSGAAAAKTRPGSSASVGACAVPSLFSGGTEAQRCLGVRGRIGLRLPGAEQARRRNAAGLLPDPRGTGEACGAARFPPWTRNPKTLMASYCFYGGFSSRGKCTQ